MRERKCISAADHILFFPLGEMDGGVTFLGEVHLLLHAPYKMKLDGNGIKIEEVSRKHHYRVHFFMLPFCPVLVSLRTAYLFITKQPSQSEATAVLCFQGF